MQIDRPFCKVRSSECPSLLQAAPRGKVPSLLTAAESATLRHSPEFLATLGTISERITLKYLFLLRQILQSSATAQLLTGLFDLARSKNPILSQESRLSSLARAARRLSATRLRGLARKPLLMASTGESGNRFLTNKIGWARYGKHLTDSKECGELTTSLILKTPQSDGTPGVLYASFEHNWLKLLSTPKRRRLLDEYILVGASSWSPTDYAALASLVGASKYRSFIGISNWSDLESYRVLPDSIQPLKQMACDWVDPTLYEPLSNEERDIDLLMVAHWGRFKRHDLLFRILKTMRSNLNVALVGRDTEGRTAETILAEARAAGCRQNISTFTRIPNSQVTALQCRAKASVITTQREGSCVAVTESFAANTPVAMLRGAHIGSSAHINASTGIFLEMSTASRQLERLIDERGAYSPRAWMMGKIDARSSSDALDATIGEYMRATGRQWDAPICPLRWVYVPTYLNPSHHDRFADERERLVCDFDVSIRQYPRTPGAVG